jgi:hypothetical protein
MAEGPIETPEWTFAPEDLKRFGIWFVDGGKIAWGTIES